MHALRAHTHTKNAHAHARTHAHTHTHIHTVIRARIAFCVQLACRRWSTGAHIT
jgi:hypothetical protein